MNWATGRKFLAAWMGTTIGHLFAGTGALYRLDAIDVLTGYLSEDLQGNTLYALIVLLVFSAIHATGPMIGYPDEDEQRRHVRRVVSPKNYFRSGLWNAVVPWLILLTLAGFGVDVSQLFGLGQGESS